MTESSSETQLRPTPLHIIINRNLSALKLEIELYPHDDTLWVTIPGCSNSGGTLALHLVGNLRHFVGAQMGGSGYIRKRDEEFSKRDLSRRDLVDLIETTRSEVTAALATIDPTAMASPSLAPVGEGAISLELWLLHLSGHLSYHLGQINYHRRILTGDSTGSGGGTLKALLDEL